MKPDDGPWVRSADDPLFRDVKPFAEPAVPEVRVGGEPPSPAVGMVYSHRWGQSLVTEYGETWPREPLAVFGAWGGPLIWRRS